MKINAFVIDTNVPVIANRNSESQKRCALECIRRIRTLFEGRAMLVLDDHGLIFREYLNNLKPLGQPQVGSEFMRWVITHQFNPGVCERVAVELRSSRVHDFADFPPDAALKKFDKSDRKFVVAALKSIRKPTVVHASDRGWTKFGAALANLGLTIENLCP